MQPPKDEQELTDFTLEAMTALFEPSPSIFSSESPGLISPDHPPRSLIHGRNISTERPSSFATLDCSHSISPTSRHPPRLPNTHSRSTSGVSNYTPSFEPYPKPSLQYRNRSNSEDEDHSDDCEAFDLNNPTEEQKREFKRKQNTMAARRSRKRKAEETQTLRDDNARLRTEIAVWKERALMMERLLKSHGVPCPSFSS